MCNRWCVRGTSVPFIKTKWCSVHDVGQADGMKCKLTPGSTPPQSGLRRGRPRCIYSLEERLGMQRNNCLFVRHSSPAEKLLIGVWRSGSRVVRQSSSSYSAWLMAGGESDAIYQSCGRGLLTSGCSAERCHSSACNHVTPASSASYLRRRQRADASRTKSTSGSPPSASQRRARGNCQW